MKTIHNTRYQALLMLLLEAREAAGLTQKELATRLDRPQSFVSKTENAERRLDVIEFLEVCKGIGVDPYEVLRGLETTISTLNAPLPPNTDPASP
ncbi:transcriptional regulator [Pseudomonas cichorii]|uniref:Helix-turn-helix transcriptional regulator n=1 Tax=Pseudomonas serbiensis TaxID=3064350 RepID=A0ABT9CYJ0_9PSED|nr:MULTISPECIES: helix-turn-helix transcriptional regulator [Pseudomonas]MDO7929136.1 helix-turn-helix transcriptional regulator [Pseudomonas sp. KFB-138]GFM77144.1 transcriptional regulator [Pseudomonas cichorii]GFM87068.1 transcriptional regulator [Pseudomonas cichorii]